ncbi:hypothetical protein [Bradyrhizobium sp.]|uniref:hypothetical protein n=1 Tax=Bradyrhizobium sp. TaxID=376 RepID=UPI0026227907|nr:hypothetical protein [Bradyrhizobium sp.]
MAEHIWPGAQHPQVHFEALLVVAARRLSGGRAKLVRLRESHTFKGFQRNFLGQHDVARNQATIRYHAPTYFWRAVLGQFQDIRANSKLDPIFLAAFTADDVEMTLRVELGKLRR